jgi:hypothetical protein
MKEIIYFFEHLKKARTHKNSFAEMGQTEPEFQLFVFSIWLHVGQDDINLAMCISSTFGLLFGRSSG